MREQKEKLEGKRRKEEEGAKLFLEKGRAARAVRVGSAAVAIAVEMDKAVSGLYRDSPLVTSCDYGFSGSTFEANHESSSPHRRIRSYSHPAAPDSKKGDSFGSIR